MNSHERSASAPVNSHERGASAPVNEAAGEDRYGALLAALRDALRRGDVPRAAKVDLTVKSLLETTAQRANVDPLARRTLESVRASYTEAIEVGSALRDEAALEAARGRQERAAASAYRTMGYTSASDK